jgi:5-methylcytosine-specific restriction endonuclease McrA
MPYKDPEKAAECKRASYNRRKALPEVIAKKARNTAVYRARHPERARQAKLASERKRFATNAEYRALSRAKAAKKQRAKRKTVRIKKYRAIHQKARQYKLRSLGKVASAENVSYALEQYRFGDRYMDVYSGELISTPTLDHVVALNSGGSNEWPNLAVTSARNNSMKGKKSLIQFLLSRHV